MMHAFPRTFSLPQDRHERASAQLLAPLTPAAYLRLRREAAGMSITAVAVMMTRNARDVTPAVELIQLLETPGNTARRPETLERLRTAFPFDPDVYRQLKDEPASRHPNVCRGCGCSEWDRDPDGAPWDWATASACTRCLDDGAARAERRA